MANDTGALTNMWMTNPWMFDPTQKSNPYSNFNAGRIPFPPTYNGVPTNAATGQPIQSFLDWQQANPAGTTLNNTPTQPQQPQQPDVMALRNAALTGQPGAAMAYGANFAPQGSPPGIQQMYGQNFAAFTPQRNWQNATPAAAPQAAPQAPPNNWQAALNALANPGKVQTPGATVPLQTGSQPAGGVNQAWLNQIGSGQGMNQNFISALAAIQGRGGQSPGGQTGGAAPGINAPPAQGQPGTAFSQLPTWGSGGSIGGGPTNTNSLAGYSNTLPGTDPFANFGAFRTAQQRLAGR